MNRRAVESLDKEALIDLVLTLAARVAEPEAKLGLPPKTPRSPEIGGEKPSKEKVQVIPDRIRAHCQRAHGERQHLKWPAEVWTLENLTGADYPSGNYSPLWSDFR